jgi:hypothetical protein
MYGFKRLQMVVFKFELRRWLIFDSLISAVGILGEADQVYFKWHCKGTLKI